MGAVYSQILADMTAQGWAPPRRRIHVNKAYLALDRFAACAHLTAQCTSSAQGWRDLPPPCAYAAGRARPSPSMRRRCVPGGRCRSYYDHATGMLIDNGTHILMSGNHAARALRRDRRLRRGPGRPGAGRLSLRRSRQQGALVAALQRRAHALVGVRQGPPRARHQRHRLSAAGAARFRRRRPADRRSHRLQRAALSAPARSRCCSRRSISSRARARRSLPRRSFAKRWRAAARPAGRCLRTTASAMSSSSRRLPISRRAASPLPFRTSSSPCSSPADTCARSNSPTTPRPWAPDDAVILAVPPYAATKLLPDLTVPTLFRGIVNAHFRIDPPAAMPPMLGVINGTVEWIFSLPGPHVGDHQRAPTGCLRCRARNWRR